MQAHEDTEFSDRFAGIDGIDVKTALKNCMNTDILKNTVHDFYVSAKTGPAKIEKLWREENISEFTITVHALKSSARLIGALDLNELAAKLEEYGDNGDLSSIGEYTPMLLEKYRYYEDSLALLFDDGDPEDDDRELIDPSALSEAYGAIREAVTAFDFNTADELMGMLKEYRIPKEEEDRYLRICDMVTKLEREALLEELANG